MTCPKLTARSVQVLLKCLDLAAFNVDEERLTGKSALLAIMDAVDIKLTENSDVSLDDIGKVVIVFFLIARVSAPSLGAHSSGMPIVFLQARSVDVDAPCVRLMGFATIVEQIGASCDVSLAPPLSSGDSFRLGAQHRGVGEVCHPCASLGCFVV